MHGFSTGRSAEKWSGCGLFGFSQKWHQLYLSEEIISEINKTFRDSRFRRTFAELTDEMIEAFLLEIRLLSNFADFSEISFIFERDPKDQKYITLAVALNAQYLVSRDRDLLDLMTGFDDASKDFRRRFRYLKIVEPITFLNIVRDVARN